MREHCDAIVFPGDSINVMSIVDDDFNCTFGKEALLTNLDLPGR
jgi:hypothetical protein